MRPKIAFSSIFRNKYQNQSCIPSICNLWYEAFRPYSSGFRHLSGLTGLTEFSILYILSNYG